MAITTAPKTTSSNVGNTYQSALERQLKVPKPTNQYDDYAAQEYKQAKEQTTPFQYQAAKDTSTGKSVYDIQRERVSQQATNQQKTISDAISRRLAAQGLGGGVETKQLRNIAVDMAKSEAQGIGDVNIAELTAAEQARQQQQQMDYATKERLGTQAYQAQQYANDQALQRENLYATLSANEKQLAEGARQFDNQLDFNKWSAEQGYSQAESDKVWQSAEAEKGRTFTAGEAEKQRGFEGVQADKGRAEQARQFNSQLDFQKWATTQGWSQDQIQRAWQSSEAEKARTSTEKIAGAELSLREKDLAQQAKQFATQLEFNRWATDRGYSEAEAQRGWQSSEAEKARKAQAALTMADLDLQERQFFTTAQQAQDELSFKKQVQAQGLSEAQAQRTWQASQNEKERALQAGLAGAEMTFKEKQLALQADQFGDELAFKQWATGAGYEQQEADRVWQSGESALERKSRTQLAQMDNATQMAQMAQQASQFTSQLDFNRWAETQGITQQVAQRAWQGEQNAKQIQSQERLAGKEISMEEARLAQAASQFTDELSFKKWAQSQNIDDAQATRAFQFYQNEADRNLQTQLAKMQQSNQITMQDKELAQQARQFTSEQEFNKWATVQGWAQDEIQRGWQASQNAQQLLAQSRESGANREQQLYELQFQAGEAEKDRAWKTAIEQSGLSLQEKQLAEQSRQFDTEQQFQNYALRQGWNQDEIQRTWQAQMAAKEQEAVANNQLTQLREQARQFDTEQAFQQWAAQSNIDQQTAQRAWQSSESALDRGATAKIQMADLSLREKQLAQQGSQFETEQQFQQWATEQGFSQQEAQRAFQAKESTKAITAQTALQTGAQSFEAQQAELQRKFTSGQQLTAQDYQAAQSALDRAQQTALATMNLTQQDKELAQQATQFKTQLEFNRWAEANNIAEADKNRAWQSSEQAKQLGAQQNMQIYEIAKRGELQTQLANLELTNNTELERMRLESQKGLLDYQTISANKQAADKMMADSYYAMAVSGRELPDRDMESLKRSSPLAYYAYQSGLAGKDKAEVDNDLAFRTKVMDALITSSADDQTDDFIGKLSAIAQSMGINSVDFAGLGVQQGATAGTGGTAAPVSPFTGDIANKLMTKELAWQDLNIKGATDPKYQSLMTSKIIPDVFNPSVTLNKEGANRIQVLDFESSFKNGTPIRLQNIEDGSLDVWVVTEVSPITGDAGANRTVYTMRRLSDGTQQKIRAIDANPGAGTSYQVVRGGA